MNIDLTEEIIKNKIGEIIDSDLGISLKELNSVKQIKFNDKELDIKIELIPPVHLVSGKIFEQCILILKELAPNIIPKVNIEEKVFDFSERKFLKKVKNIIAVASGKGGVGKSAVAANLAAVLSLTGAKVGILDGDVYGPSQPLMFGLEGESLLAHDNEEGKTVAVPNEKYGIKVASMGFVMNRDEAAIIRGPLLASYFSMLYEQIEWGELDYLIFDLPPGTGDIQLTLTQRIPLTGAVIVTTPQDIAVADVRRSIAMFNQMNIDILGIIENMSYFVPADSPDKKYYIFGKGGGQKVADENGIKILGQIPISEEMRNSIDSGIPLAFAQNSGTNSEILKNIGKEIVCQIRKINFKKLNSVIK